MRGMGRGPWGRPYRPWGMRRMWIPWFPFLGLIRLFGLLIFIGLIFVIMMLF